MGVYLNPGADLFKRAVNSQIYVDKTGLIELTNGLIDSEQSFVCVSRPRRFGKSMAANMLAAYYSKDEDASMIFDAFEIAKSDSYRKYMNQCNVIALNIQSFLSLISDVSEALKYLQKRVMKDLRTTYPGIVDPNEMFLSIALEDIYNAKKEKFIFIIDEWDCILRDKTYTEEDHKKYLDFIRNLLKDKPYVSFAYMTGILPIKKYGTHSALNMFTEFSMTDPGDFAKYIGFTEQEVMGLCTKHDLDYEAVKTWYDGYTFSENLHIYNPKSVVDSILRKRISSYWTQTETYEALKIYIQMNYDGLKDSVIRMLAGEKVKIDIRTFQNDMTTFGNKDDVLTLLIHLGYLAFEQTTQSVYIPNFEVEEEFIRSVKSCKWDGVIKAIEYSERILSATWMMEERMVAEMIDLIHEENTSILTYNDENSLSCVMALAYYSAQNEYIKIRELPAGKGFADIVYIPKKSSDKIPLVVELKYDKNAEGAISQIKEKRYVNALKDYHGEVLLVGINYRKDSKDHECKIEKIMV